MIIIISFHPPVELPQDSVVFIDCVICMWEANKCCSIAEAHTHMIS